VPRMSISISIKQLLSECKVHGNGDAQVMISDTELLVLIYLSWLDLGWDIKAASLSELELPSHDYYSIPIGWFRGFCVPSATPQALLKLLNQSCDKHPDFVLYIRNLSALHRRRVKYSRILSSQPLATVDQIGPRVLLEFGECDISLLGSWMLWRKWIYDIDNRSAQETGYFFEPVLASCLGGESIGARNSPVKRIDGAGRATDQGRQVDCFVAASKRVYELKLRVSVAASGQGRFSEELSFPRECRAAGFAPYLLVLDPTHSNRLQELEAAFVSAGGVCYKGAAAWRHMEQAAGEVMSHFVKKYIKPPLESFDRMFPETPSAMHIDWKTDLVEISSGDNKYFIKRVWPPIEEP
jgi:hypothetical protein